MESLKPWADFMNDGAGLERTLRLVQGLLMIFATVSIKLYSSYWLKEFYIVRKEIALARRFFRLFRWIDCWHTALERIGNLEWQKATPQVLLGIAERSVLGLYFLLDMITLANFIGVVQSVELVALDHYAQQLWFHSISMSIVLTLDQLFRTTASTSTAPATSSKDTTGVSEKAGSKKASPSAKNEVRKSSNQRTQLQKRLIMDCCDLTIPALALGWLKADPAIVGLAMVVSSYLSCRDIWSRIQVSKSKK